MDDFEIVAGYVPGVVGRVTELHALYYAKYWNFGEHFETKVATELSEFISNYNKEQDAIFSLFIDGEIEGSISILGSCKKIAHLRWFIISEKLRGKGAGNYLMKQAMTFCEQNEYNRVYLCTFQGLDSARHLYEKYGFRLTEEKTGKYWGYTVTEQRFDAIIRAPENT